MSATALALIGFAGWFVLLTLALAFVRIPLVLTGKKAANTFAVDGTDMDPFGRRLTRARDNCYETLPAFAAIAVGAHMSGRLEVTNGLAMWVLWARIGQSIVHIASTSVPAVWIRATLFFVQVLIYLYWTYRLLLT